MNFIKHILSILLVTVVLNTVITKGLHELLEHHSEEHECVDTNSTHFHNHEFGHLDFICEFNISTVLLNGFTLYRKGIIPYIEEKTAINNQWIIAENSFNSIKLRGPPYLNS